MRKSCVTEPLNPLITQGSIKQVAIIHSDPGSQYRSYEFAGICEQNGLRQSMSAAGKPIDNAVAEAFFKTMKTEVIKPNRHLTREQMQVLIRNYLEDYYSNQRIHSSLFDEEGVIETRRTDGQPSLMDIIDLHCYGFTEELFKWSEFTYVPESQKMTLEEIKRFSMSDYYRDLTEIVPREELVRMGMM